MALQKDPTEEVRPREFATRGTDIPPRRMGLQIFTMLTALAAAWYLVTLGYMTWENSRFEKQLEILSRMQAGGTGPDQSKLEQAIERHLAMHDAAEQRLWNSAERIELALIALLSAVAGYSLKRNA